MVIRWLPPTAYCLPHSQLWTLDFGRWTNGSFGLRLSFMVIRWSFSGYRLLPTAYRILNFGPWTLDVGLTGHLAFGRHSWSFMVIQLLPPTAYCLPHSQLWTLDFGRWTNGSFGLRLSFMVIQWSFSCYRLLHSPYCLLLTAYRILNFGPWTLDFGLTRLLPAG